MLRATGASGGAMNEAILAAKLQRAQIASIEANIDGLTGVHKRGIWLA